MPTPAERFQNNMIVFIEDVEDMVEDAKANNVISGGMPILILVKAAIKNADGEDIIFVFLERTFEHWDKIFEEDEDHIGNIIENIFEMTKGGKLEDIKNDKYFSKASGLISKLSSSNLDTINKVFTGKYMEDGEEVPIFDEERKRNFWDLLKSFVKISLCHVHETRKMEGGKYKVDFFPNIPVKDTAKKWKVKLA